MKRIIGLILTAIILVLSLTSCGLNPDDKNKNKDTTTPTASAGKRVQAEKFSIVVPDDWKGTVIDGGFQIYKTSGEVVEVYFRGAKQSKNYAKQQVEAKAKAYSGTKAKEIGLLGKMFWNTTYTANGITQVFDACIVKGGVMISIKYGGPSLGSNPEYLEIVNSIVWK